MNIPVSTYYKSSESDEKRKLMLEREAATISLINSLREQWPAYGYRRITAELKRRGFAINHKRVARIMREHPVKVRVKRPKYKQKDFGELGAAFPFIARNFTPTGPDQLWVTDITYIRLRSGFVYLSVMIDAWSRKVVGYAASHRINVRLVTATLEDAYDIRKPEPGLIHHSDRGAQYLAKSYQLRLSDYGMVGSMSRKGTPTDNAQAESFMKTLKHEEVYQFGYETVSDVKARLPRFLEDVYNRRRIHSALGYMTPEEFEIKHAGKRSN